jgi:hypothetical protein
MADKTDYSWFEYSSGTHSFSSPLSVIPVLLIPGPLSIPEPPHQSALKSSSSVKCFKTMAPVGHTALHSPSPLQITGLTIAFLALSRLAKLDGTIGTY